MKFVFFFNILKLKLRFDYKHFDFINSGLNH